MLYSYYMSSLLWVHCFCLMATPGTLSRTVMKYEWSGPCHGNMPEINWMSCIVSMKLNSPRLPGFSLAKFLNEGVATRWSVLIFAWYTLPWPMVSLLIRTIYISIFSSFLFSYTFVSYRAMHCTWLFTTSSTALEEIGKVRPLLILCIHGRGEREGRGAGGGGGGGWGWWWM